MLHCMSKQKKSENKLGICQKYNVYDIIQVRT